MKTNKGSLAFIIMILAQSAARGQLMETHSFVPGTQGVPDGNAAGWSDVQAVTSGIVKIGTMRVRVHIAGEFNGDLYGYLRHIGNAETNFCVLLNRPGRTATNGSGYADAGMDVGFEDGAPNGDIHGYGSVTNLAAGVALTGIWEADGRTNDPALVLDSSARATSLGTFVGAKANGEWTLFVADMDSGGTNSVMSWGLEITGQGIPAVTWSQPADVTYGAALGPGELNAAAEVPGTFEYSPPAGTVLRAGSNQVLSVTFTPDDVESYLPVTVAVRITVQRKELIITADDTNKVYGAPLPGFSASYQGFVNGDTASNLATPVGLSTLATDTSDAGTYEIMADGASSPDYAISYVAGVLTITRAVTQGQVSASANPALPGQTVTFSFTATAVAPGSGVPTGLVQFKIDGADAGGPVALSSGGTAEFAIGTLAVGVHSVSAEYAGDRNFFGTTNVLASDELVNTPPVPGTVVVERDPTNGTKVAIATLVKSAFDADGDVIVFDGVSPSSASGGIVTTNGAGWIFYAPPAGFTNSDLFTYQISDGRGAPVTGFVTVNVRVDNGPSPNLTISTLPDGSYRIQFDGIYGRTYRIQYTEDLVTWTTLGSATADVYGRYEYVDKPTGGTGRYYRSVYP